MKYLKIAAAILGLCFVFGVGLLIWILFEINDEISRCSDPSSGTYIFDDADRKAACDQRHS